MEVLAFTYFSVPCGRYRSIFPSTSNPCWRDRCTVSAFTHALRSTLFSNTPHIDILAAHSACAQLGDLDLGSWIHEYIKMVRLEHSKSLKNSLVEMYSKCGDIDIAHGVFDDISKRCCLLEWYDPSTCSSWPWWGGFASIPFDDKDMHSTIWYKLQWSIILLSAFSRARVISYDRPKTNWSIVIN